MLVSLLYTTVDVANRKSPVLLPGSCIFPSRMGSTVMHSSYTNQRRGKVAMDDQYTQLSKNLSHHLRSASSQLAALVQ